VVLVFMLLLVNRRDLMGEHVNRPAMNAVAWVTVLVMSTLSVYLAALTLGGGA
jgi:Mn2+/Fe2+ NRAMP family transporter